MSNASGSPRSGPALLCYDGSDDARAAIETAGRLLGGGPAIVAVAWRPVAADRVALAIPGLSGQVREAVEEIDQIAEQHARERAEEGCGIARDAGFDAQPLAVVAHDAVWAALTGAADEHGAGTVVLGRRGLSAVAATALGSVSMGVLHHARAPVLIVPPAESS